MNIKNAFITATRALNRNRMRSALTSIGIIIGVSSVIIMIGIGNSARIAVKKKIYTAGANAISIYNSAKPLTGKEMEDIKRIFPQIQYITPQISTRHMPVKYFNRSLTSLLYGVSKDFFYMQGWDMQYGSSFTEREISSKDKVVVIGNTVRTELFGHIDPVGKLILIRNIPFKVIGSLTGKGQAFSGTDFDNILIIPFTTAQTRIFGGRNFDQINVSTYTSGDVDDTIKGIKNYFRKTHNISPGNPDDFKIETSKQKLKQADYIANILAILLAFIASISLIVGGIGIMNIMLVSVRERTREIGIRMAIGARRKDVLLQFLIESVVLSSAGGIIGIVLGILIYYIIVILVDWPFLFSMASVVVSFIFAGLVGIFFGYYPAKKAAALKPIDALHFE